MKELSHIRVVCALAAIIRFVTFESTLSAGADSWQVQSGDWSVSSNWGGHVPAITDDAFIVNGGTATVTQSGYSFDTLYMGNGGGSGTIQMTAGGLSTNSSEYIGYKGLGSFIQSGGTNTTGILYIGGETSPSIGAYYLSGGGLLDAADEGVGFSSVVAGTFTQSGGTNGCGDLAITPAGTYNLNGGVLSVTYEVEAAGGVLNFSGGTIQTYYGTEIFQPIVLGTSGGGGTFDTFSFSSSVDGTLSGSGSLNKIDAGTLSLAGTNTYTGNTRVSGGVLALGNPLAMQYSTLDTSGSGMLSFGTLTSATLGGLAGPGSLNLVNSVSGSVAISVGRNNNSTTFSGHLIGPGSLTKIGIGSTLLAGACSYSGTTSVNQGSLIVNNSLQSSVVVNSGGMLGGTGSLTSVTIASGGTLAPGSPLGSMQLTGSLTLLAGAALDYELDAPLDSSEVYMPSGVLNLNGQQFTDFDFLPMSNYGEGDYVLIDASSINGSLGAETSGTIDGRPASIAMEGNELVLNVAPEPGSLALLATGVLALLTHSRRKRA